MTLVLYAIPKFPKFSKLPNFSNLPNLPQTKKGPHLRALINYIAVGYLSKYISFEPLNLPSTYISTVYVPLVNVSPS